ncbi:iron complex transport system substrate-binding protein [Paenibacillus algorifonticola]|uniref:Iron complex transport system substrate-binding protein n=1 Tax=Paenibacillus algorifonticola TaxID=684063 RepID=A0A1I2F4B5_9BACL|nr:iron complex transport system substrate-binding protein [Paenibacillus algorifonticola]
MFLKNQSQNHKRSMASMLAMLLLCVSIFTACGSAESSETGKTNTESEATAQPSSEASNAGAGEATPEATADPNAVKTISTVKGDIEIPAQPKRIVAEEYLGSLIALGVVPIGAPGLTLQNYYFKEALTGVEDTGEYGKPSAEKIAALAPDLIITGNGESYELLSKIAPTLFIPYGDLKNAHEELTYFGDVLGKEQEAKTWLEEFDRRIAEAKAKVDAAIPADATFSIFEHTEKSTYAYGDNFGRGGQPVYQALGRKPPTDVAEVIMEKQWAELSAEIVPQYAGDYIVMTSNDWTLADFQADPIWSNLPAVKNGKLYVWPEERSWYYDPLAVLAQTEELADWLAKGN